ncbi:MAG: phosphoribosylaminoimidazolesuccinocarboxamide synthase [Candidatus Bathyarchaeia archaeon]
MGSVKDLQVLAEPRKDRLGLGRFVFSDRYSVFDWGEMPDLIPFKGASLCLISAYFFQKMEGVCNTHYLGVVEGGRMKALDELESPTNVMEIRLVRVLRPRLRNGELDYTVFKKERSNFLIPLEIIYRNSLPPGSSVFKRIQRGEVSYRDLGLDSYPKPGCRLEKPILDVSTKLEDPDRYLTWDEAREIASLSVEEVEEVRRLTLKVNSLITAEVLKAGLFNEDGKIELAFDSNRRLMVVDAVGTPDECRFTLNGFHVSKEAAREFYRGTKWFKEVEMAKKAWGTGCQGDWRSHVRLKPPPLSPDVKRLISNLYAACANEITGRRWFDVPQLRSVVEEYGSMVKDR